MPLEPVQLDDLTWSDLTTTARDRIAAESGGQWTLHAPVDPGITLLELFAAQLEQRLYMLDQPSDSLTAALLKLAGIRPQPVGIAATVLSFRESDPPADRPTQVETLIMNLDSDDLLALQTQRTFTWLPVNYQRRRRRQRVDNRQPISLRVGDHDRTLDLESGRSPCLFAAQGAVRESQVLIWLRDWQPGLQKTPQEKVTVSILFDLEVPEGVQPQWIDDFKQDAECVFAEEKSDGDEKLPLIKEVAPAADISWSYQTASGQFVDVVDVEDGTNGFRRSGIVRITLPPEPTWCVDSRATTFQSPTNVDTSSSLALCLRIRATNVSYSFLPRVSQIVPNAVIARHKLAIALSADDKQELARQIGEWRPLPGNELGLPADEFDESVIPQSARTDNELCLDTWDARFRQWQRLPIPARLRLLERGTAGQAEWHEWTITQGFDHLGPADRFFVVDRPRGKLLFADGLTGRIPIPADPVEFEIEYEVGGGAKGNRPAFMKWASAARRSASSQSSSDVWRAVNVVPGIGGADPESLEDAARAAKSKLRQPTRAVTRSDIEELAKMAPGTSIRRAHAAIGFIERHRCIPVPAAVTVFIVPDLPAKLRRFHSQACGDDLVALTPDPSVLDAVACWLNRVRLITHEIRVAGPEYIEVELHVRIEGSPIDADTLRKSVTETLQEFLHPLYGGPQGTGWPFGEPLRPSELVKRVQDAVDEDLHVRSVSIGIRGRASAPIGDAKGGSLSSGTCRCVSIESIELPEAEPTLEDCREVGVPPHALVALRNVEVVFVQSVLAESGGLL